MHHIKDKPNRTGISVMDIISGYGDCFVWVLGDHLWWLLIQVIVRLST